MEKVLEELERTNEALVRSAETLQEYEANELVRYFSISPLSFLCLMVGGVSWTMRGILPVDCSRISMSYMNRRM